MALSLPPTGPHPFWGGRPQALHVAVESRHREIFDLLLEAGADASGRNDEYEHWSPLALAIERGETGMQRALLAAGARTGLMEALLLGDDAAVARLVPGDGPALPATRPNGGSWLAFARTVTAIDRLLELGADPHLPDRWGASPIEALSRLGARLRAGHEQPALPRRRGLPRLARARRRRRLNAGHLLKPPRRQKARPTTWPVAPRTCTWP